MENPESFTDLVAIMDRLRGPGGCPWDLEQTYGTLRGFLLEECYEVAEALDRGDREALREELGDLLFQIVFLSRLAKEEGHFTVADVVRGIAKKMVRRHPHVFGEASADTPEQVLRHWEAIKRKEKEDPEGSSPSARSILDGTPKALPALMKAQRLGDKAARVGFDWKCATDVLDKTGEELDELRVAVGSDDREAAREELGDLFFTLVMLARHLRLDPEEALEKTNSKFQGRFRKMEQEIRRRGLTLEEAGLELLDRLWNEAKANDPDP